MAEGGRNLILRYRYNKLDLRLKSLAGEGTQSDRYNVNESLLVSDLIIKTQ